MRTDNAALRALATDDELEELRAAGLKPLAEASTMPRKAPSKPVRLQYLKDSARMGLALWNVLQPQLEGYPPCGPLNGYPTLSAEGLQKVGLI